MTRNPSTPPRPRPGAGVAAFRTPRKSSFRRDFGATRAGGETVWVRVVPSGQAILLPVYLVESVTLPKADETPVVTVVLRDAPDDPTWAEKVGAAMDAKYHKKWGLAAALEAVEGRDADGRTGGKTC